MGDFSRDSFTETQNALSALRGTAVAPLDDSKHYVSVRLQQRVPVVDADWNEQDDIRRLEVETLLQQTIGSGVPANSDGFRILEATDSSGNFHVEAGLILVDGWLVYNPQGFDYITQPHLEAQGLAPGLPIPLPDAPVARLELAYLDVWERQVDRFLDESLVDPLIGLETAVRIERVFVVRMETIAPEDDPRDLATIPNQQPGHRYYPLALVNRQPGATIADIHLEDLRRTHLTLAELTDPPLLVDDALREQTLDAARFSAMFAANLAALDDVFRSTPDAFVYPAEVEATWALMTLYQDVRSLATALQEQALRDQLPNAAAMDAITRFFEVEVRFRDELTRLLDPPPVGVNAGESAQDFLASYSLHLTDEPDSLDFAIQEQDLLGAVLAQERLNHEIAELGGSRLDGSVSLSLVAVTPNEPVVANVTYQLTVRVSSFLISQDEEEEVRVLADAGLGWTTAFVGSAEEDTSEILLTLPNQSDQDVVLQLTASPGAAPTALELRAYPERRQQRLFRHNDLALAIGSPILPEEAIVATMTYTGTELEPGNVISNATRETLFSLGIPLPFQITNLSSEEEDFLLTVTPDGPANGWDATTTELVMNGLAPGEVRDESVHFQTSDQAGATSPQLFTIGLSRVVDGGDDEPLPSTEFSVTFQLP